MAAKNTSREVRIIGGKWKGRKIRFRGNSTLRPTPGRTRETLFNWLRPHIEGAHCLDLFAGSGVLGFEALSQGAAFVSFVEKNRTTLGTLNDVAGLLDCGAAASFHGLDARRYLRTLREGTSFDLTFLDPPFDHPGLVVEVLEIAAQRDIQLGYVFIETGDPAMTITRVESMGWHQHKATRAGDSHAYLFTQGFC